MANIHFYLTLAVISTVITHGFSKLAKPSGCGATIGCFAICPDGDDDCKCIATWSANEDQGVVDFELHLAVPSPYAWISLGLSSDKVMGGDSVTDCIVYGFDATVSKSYNTAARTNNPIAEEGLSNTTAVHSDGVLSCTYKQTVNSINNQIFNLNDDWHLLIAYGVPSGLSKRQHDTTGEDIPKISKDKVDLQSNEDVTVAKEILVKVHGCLMMFGWMFCASIGIVLARFYKPMFPGSTLCKEKIWFSYHRALMVTCFLVVVAAFVIIFVDVEGWAHLDGHSKWQKAHPYIGCIVTFFVVLNPIMALLRPHPDTKNRFIFNWLHWLVGTVAQILSVMAIVLGITLGKSSVPFYVVWIVVGWAAYQFVFVLMMEMHECTIAGVASKYDKDGHIKSPPGSGAKIGFLLLHVLIITVVSAVSIVLVAIN